MVARNKVLKAMTSGIETAYQRFQQEKLTTEEKS